MEGGSTPSACLLIGIDGSSNRTCGSIGDSREISLKFWDRDRIGTNSGRMGDV